MSDLSSISYHIKSLSHNIVFRAHSSITYIHLIVKQLIKYYFIVALARNKVSVDDF